MRHRVHGRKLGRTSAHRKALFRNQLTALITHERIITTIAKAKELRPIAERMVTIARSDTLAARRKVATMVQDKEIARRLFDEIAPRFADRPGGYTRIMRLGRRRGDNAELAIIEFVDYELSEHAPSGEGGGKSSFLDRAKGVFGGKPAAEATDDEVGTAADETDADEEIDAAPVGDEPEPEAAVDDNADTVVEAAAEEAVEEPKAEPEEAAEEVVKAVADEAEAEDEAPTDAEAATELEADEPDDEKKDA